MEAGHAECVEALVTYVRTAAERASPGNTAGILDGLHEIVGLRQDGSVRHYLETASSKIVQYAHARSRPSTKKEAHYSTQDSIVYQRWRESQYKVHERARTQSPEARDMRVARYEAWMDVYGLQDSTALTSLKASAATDVCSMVVFHGVPSREVALTIVQHGMMQACTTDCGWYGQGFYFTPELAYALNEYSRPDPAAGGQRFVVMSAVLCGNVYPVVEHPVDGADPTTDPHCRREHRDLQLRARAMVPGFDTHIVWVQSAPDSAHGMTHTPAEVGVAVDAASVRAGAVHLEVVAQGGRQILPLAVLGFE